MKLFSLCGNRLILTAVLLAMKVHQDAYHTNKHMALVGGMSNAEVNSLELEFLKTIGFEALIVPKETFQSFAEYLQALKDNA
jgi:Cyclin